MSSKKSNKGFFIALAVTFLLPLSIYLFVREKSKNAIVMPKYHYVPGIDSISPQGDTIYHKVGDLTLTNQNGEQVSLSSLKDKIIVFNFFFIDCNTTCPKMSTNMKYLQNSFKKSFKKINTLDTVVQLISISVMPERDSFQRLRVYADKYKANPDNWWFLTGSKKDIYAFARTQLGLITGPGDGGAEDFIHSDKFVLVDKDRFIRGYYNGTVDSLANKCADDIVLLTLEKKHLPKSK
jgi:protein SCO1/2